MSSMLYFILVFNIAICSVGVFSKKFDDNLLQRLGMVVIILFEVIRISQLVNGLDMDSLRVWIHYGIFFYCSGCALKYWAIYSFHGQTWPGVLIKKRYGRRRDDRIDQGTQNVRV